jgi:hypothetical protein
MTKISQIPNKPPSDSVVWDFPDLRFVVSEFVLDFDIRISDLFGCSLARGNPVSGTDRRKICANRENFQP